MFYEVVAEDVAVSADVGTLVVVIDESGATAVVDSVVPLCMYKSLIMSCEALLLFTNQLTASFPSSLQGIRISASEKFSSAGFLGQCAMSDSRPL